MDLDPSGKSAEPLAQEMSQHASSRCSYYSDMDQYLVTLEELQEVLPTDSFPIADSSNVKEELNAATNYLVNDLPWEHIVAAGNAINTVMAYIFWDDQCSDAIESLKLELYVYGVEPEEANQILADIWQAFKRQAPNPALIKGSRKATMFNGEAECVTVPLQLFRSKAEVLSSFYLDQLATGFDGTTVIMSPRGALALETGSNLFTADLVHNLIYAVDCDYADTEEAEPTLCMRLTRPHADAIEKVHGHKQAKIFDELSSIEQFLGCHVTNSVWALPPDIRHQTNILHKHRRPSIKL